MHIFPQKLPRSVVTIDVRVWIIPFTDPSLFTHVALASWCNFKHSMLDTTPSYRIFILQYLLQWQTVVLAVLRQSLRRESQNNLYLLCTYWCFGHISLCNFPCKCFPTVSDSGSVRICYIAFCKGLKLVFTNVITSHSFLIWEMFLCDRRKLHDRHEMCVILHRKLMVHGKKVSIISYSSFVYLRAKT